ncbi:MAG: IS21 family transposase [Candidatus Acidiferrum sp.]
MQELTELQRQGMSIQGISKLTGWDRKTVRKYLLQPNAMPEYGPRRRQASKLDPFKPYLEERMRAGVWNAQVLLRELRGRNYTGGYTILKNWLHPQRSSARVVAVRRFETPPGKQAQVDWGHLGTLQCADQEQKLWAFTFTMGYSRRLMAEVAVDQKIGTLLRMHEEAFRQMGGVPEEILYDRMKTVWLGSDERGEIVWHPVFLDFARYWGFTPRLCRPYRAQTKGKVESGVKYLRRNFLLRTARTRTAWPRRYECATARVDCGGGQPTGAWNHPRTSDGTLGCGAVQFAVPRWSPELSLRGWRTAQGGA